MSSSSHIFYPRASLLPLLHAARYPSFTVLGCLLGPSPDSIHDDDDGPSIEYTHAIPLLHHWTGLSFAIELGLTFVEEYAALKGWRILGFYFANEGLEGGKDVPVLLKRVVSAAKEMGGSDAIVPSVFALDNKNLDSEAKAFTLVDPSTSSPLPGTITFSLSASPTSTISKASPTLLPNLIKAKQHLQLEDWDQHLEDIGARWLSNENVDLDAELEAVIAEVQKINK